MIRHIVFFSARDPEDVDRIAQSLWKLAEIPHSDFFEIGINRKVDLYANDVDVIVYAEFANEEALAAYKAHPIYEETTNRVRPMRELRYAADFVSIR
ncbi:Dabb family protein [Chelativorans composti]|jgi:Stress responsive A/B Barrel Domain.|uniref:Dabb family protein n=1 Tax=Chelativorans composti TaxID=768533 RepID=A0ABW5DLN5_9HYPH